MHEGVAAAAAVIALLVVAVTFWLRWAHLRQLRRHYALAKLRVQRLPPTSPTRLRVEAAQQAFLKGWQALGGKQDPYDCLGWFARAVEIDELGCGWRDGFERKLEQIGVLFSLPPRDDLDKYESMLAEAYLVALLHTVVQQGNQDPASDARATPQERRQQRDALEADFRVVKSRMDACVALQPDNPAVLMLRASLLQRLGGAAAATRPHLVADLQRAIRLAEEDEGGKRLRCQGLDPKQQRAFLISQCAHRLGGLQQRGKELDAAHQSYLKAAQHAEPAAAHLADTHFSLCILVLMRARPGKHQAAGGAGGACAGGGGGSNSKPAVLLQAMTHFKDGVRAEREALRWLPHLAHTDVSKALAKELLKEFAKAKV